MSTSVSFPHDLDFINKVDKKMKKKKIPTPSTVEKKKSGSSYSVLNHFNHVSFVALALGFMLIWTCVISGLLLSNTVSDKNQIDEAVSVFNGHEDVGRVLFALGHEMVSTVDVLLTTQRSPRNQEMDTYSKEALQITWQMTDLIMNNVIQRNHMKLASLLQMPYDRWIDFRSRSVALKTDPRESVELYLLVSRYLEKEYRSFFPPTVFSTPSSLLKTPLISTGIAYSLFNSGMYRRFAEMAVGTYYIKSDLGINVTEFLDLQSTSKSLIESAFQFHPKAQNRYFELRVEDEQIEEALSVVREDIIAGGVDRNNNKLAGIYLDGVKNEIARLLLTKDYLNTTIAKQIKLTTQLNKNTWFFYLSVTVIALIAVTSCLLLLCCSLRSIAFRTAPPRKGIVFKANSLLSQNHHHMNQSMNELRSRSQTLPIETIFNPFNNTLDQINSQYTKNSHSYNISSPSSPSNSTSSSTSNNNQTISSKSNKPSCYL